MSSHHSEDVSLVGLHPEPQNLLTSQRECRSLGGDMGLEQRQSRADEKASEPTPHEPGCWAPLLLSFLGWPKPKAEHGGAALL